MIVYFLFSVLIVINSADIKSRYKSLRDSLASSPPDAIHHKNLTLGSILDEKFGFIDCERSFNRNEIIKNIPKSFEIDYRKCKAEVAFANVTEIAETPKRLRFLTKEICENGSGSGRVFESEAKKVGKLKYFLVSRKIVNYALHHKNLSLGSILDEKFGFNDCERSFNRNEIIKNIPKSFEIDYRKCKAEVAFANVTEIAETPKRLRFLTKEICENGSGSGRVFESEAKKVGKLKYFLVSRKIVNCRK
ncbi:unnamed protein product [Caenorhabditis angaria]|uniref:DUF19 domain-containing protein n=1 Tax=Caenorhabditis angaria TaxID=860376 RepID=A0A9P1IRH5_9PELO|nr:unnamed protein product [Caenorhabditis angaria]